MISLRDLRRAVLRVVIVGMVRLGARLPLPANHRLGSLFGCLLAWLPNRPREVARRNLLLCFPEASLAWRHELLHRFCSELGKTALELGPLWLWPRERLLGLVREIRGRDVFEQALARGQGCVAVSPHFGAWEMAGLYLSSCYPTTSLYRPTRQGVDAFVRQGRERLGARLVPTNQAGVRALLAALRAGEVIGLLPDQDPGHKGGGVFAPFFGRPAHTVALAVTLAQRAHAPLFMVYAERLDNAEGFCVYFEEVDGILGVPLEDAVAAMNRGVERAVLRRPEQYLWSYKRFKLRPPGLQRLY